MKYLALFEKYKDIQELKQIILIKAVETHEIPVIEFFIQRGYNFDYLEVLIEMCEDEELLKYFLDKGFNIENYKDDYHFKRNMQNTNIQKKLIDFGFENLIYSTVGFNSGLKYDPKYSDIVKRFEDIEKYNL